MAPALDAHTRPIAVTGFMGAGKSTVGRLLAQRLGRPFADADAGVERRAGCSVRALWERDGEAAFRALEETVTRELLLRDDAPVIALGGGALVSDATRALVRERAFCAWLDVPFAVAWERVEGAPGARPLAGDRATFEQLGARRAEQYTAAADAIVAGEESAESVAGALAQQVWTRAGLAQLALGAGAVAIVDNDLALPRTGAVIAIEGGEDAKSPAGLERLWRALAAQELERADVIVCVGGGSVTDVGGFAAATFRRGLPWLAVPSTLVGQVDAAIGGKTAINVAAKNDVGAFWQPSAVLCDPELLETLPAARVGGRHGRGRQDRAARGRPPVGVGAGLGARPRRRRRRAPSSCSAARASRRSSWPTIPRTAGAARSSTSGTRSATGSSPWPATAASPTASASRSAWSPHCASRSSSRACRRAPRTRRRRCSSATGLPVRAPGLDPDAVLAAMRHDKKRTAGTHRMVLLEADRAAGPRSRGRRRRAHRGCTRASAH